MLICIDSNQFIFGIAQTAPDSVELLRVLRVFEVAIPRLVVREVTRNLRTPEQVKMFYRHFLKEIKAEAYEVLTPGEFLERYRERRL